jgi:protein involved in polysaccharide export with SLBB domain
MVTAFVTGDVFAPGAYEVALTATTADGMRTETASYEVAIRNRRDR